MSKESNVEQFNDWLNSEGICDLMSDEALDFKKLLKSKVEALIASEKLSLLENMKEEIQSLRPNFYAEDGWYAANSVIDAQMLTLTQEKNK